MKVHIKDLTLSQAMVRVKTALTRHAPQDIVWTSQADAQLVVIPVIGFPETRELVEKLEDAGQRYVIAQYCLRTTQKPNTADWAQIWTNAKLVWSYYNLPELCREDGVDIHMKFLHTPLGVGEKFKPWSATRRRHFIVGTSGYLPGPESVVECARAAANVARPMFHLGPEMNLGANVMCGIGMNDETLARQWSECEFVAGLRRVEGFELPAAEGLLCGARPVLYDRPHYRDWFGQFGVFVKEGTPDEVTAELTEVFKQGAKPVTAEERQIASEWFSWQNIAKKFWEAAL